MPLRRITIDEALGHPRGLSHFDTVIDARSPSEFSLDHLPGAVNWPSLDDEERRLVGTEYKQVSPFEARKRGAVLVARNIARHLEREAGDLPREWRPLVYCWRGGQRSGALALVLGQVGFDVHVLEGGYREFRRRVVTALETAGTDLNLRLICGKTGSGKSRLLQALAAQGEQVLDLEALALHRGSVLGALPGEPQPSQKQFESALWQLLQHFDRGRPVWVESESRLIGRLRVPEALLQHMRSAACLRVEMPIAARVQLLMEDYVHFTRDPSHLCERLDSLREVRGHALVEEWQSAVRAGQLEDAVSRLLDEHYDPIYLRSMGRNYADFDNAPTLLIASGAEADMAAAAAEAVRLSQIKG
jgi:tRNA 2-selenouridine synthase